MPDPKKPYAVNVKGVSKTFGAGATAIAALKEVDFHTYEGELQMIVGPSGCGKTTLLSVIAGTLHIDNGEIDVLGHRLQQMRETDITEFRKKNVGFIFQQYHLIKSLSCMENVSLPLLLNNYSAKEAEAQAITMLGLVGLKGREHEKPKNLSGGQQQRVAIARALVHKPPLIICDEPTAALDADSGAAVMELLQSVARTDGRTVIVVTHDSRIFKFADRVVTMDDGRVVESSEG